jgi:hypothetical protein
LQQAGFASSAGQTKKTSFPLQERTF